MQDSSIVAYGDLVKELVVKVGDAIGMNSIVPTEPFKKTFLQIINYKRQSMLSSCVWLALKEERHFFLARFTLNNFESSTGLSECIRCSTAEYGT